MNSFKLSENITKSNQGFSLFKQNQLRHWNNKITQDLPWDSIN